MNNRKEFITYANNGLIADKEHWHRLGRSLARTLAAKLGMLKGTFDVRSCKGSSTVLGEIILHSDWLYIQFGISCFGGESQFMYRTCNGREDYTGGMNRWIAFDQLLDLDKVAKKLMECKGGE